MKAENKTRWTVIAVAVGVLLAAGVHLAVSSALQEEREAPMGMGPGPYGPRMHGGPMGMFLPPRMMRQLNLTEEQREEIRSRIQAQFERTEAERDALASARKAFHDAVAAIEEDKGATEDVYAASEAMAKAEADLAIARAGFRTELLQILTPEQRKKLEELKAEAQQDMQERRGRRQERMKKPQEKGAGTTPRNL